VRTLTSTTRRIVAALSLSLVAGCSGTDDEASPYSASQARRGAELIKAVGCGSCHIVPGIRPADGLVGPPLDHMGKRAFIAGLLRNTPENMVAWLRDPQAFVAGNAMPDVGLSEEEATDIAAYLDTLE
jgi:cytochrome c2